MHVLIIEDDALLAMNLQMFVEELGASSSLIATSEKDAIARAEHFPPDVIIADLHLKEGLGPTAVRAIQQAIGEVPVVYVTGDPDEAARQHPGALILAKPFQEARLRAALAQLKSMTRSARAAAQRRARQPGRRLATPPPEDAR